MNEQPMSEQEALEFAGRLEQSIERWQPPRCDKCGSSAFKLTETRTDTIYQCFYRHTIYVPKSPVLKISIQWNGPQDAA